MRLEAEIDPADMQFCDRCGKRFEAGVLVRLADIGIVHDVCPAAPAVPAEPEEA